MARLRRIVIAQGLALLLAFTSSYQVMAVPASDRRPADDQEPPTGFEMATDALLVRPLMLGVTALGTIAFVLSLPFSAIGGNVGEARKRMVSEPAAYTFNRPLGYFEPYCDGDC